MTLRDDVATLIEQGKRQLYSPTQIADAILPLVIERCAGLLIENWGVTKQRFICNGTTMKDDKGHDWFFAAPEVETALKGKIAAIRQLGSE